MIITVELRPVKAWEIICRGRIIKMDLLVLHLVVVNIVRDKDQ